MPSDHQTLLLEQQRTDGPFGCQRQSRFRLLRKQEGKWHGWKTLEGL